ncbi:MAG: PrpF domain-containing protein [Alphaproteobacteria bacterium]|jgi:hypothetical protein|nr:PrpF domain-containing protein [Alphaproteobacteria bacterium]
MRQLKIPATFMRGGTSNAIVFHAKDLPEDRALWTEIFQAAIGSPDPYGRQLNGMGGGISSLSKVCVVGPPSRDDADIDYTFAQVAIRNDLVDFNNNCGNMSSAMGPFAIDEGLVEVAGDEAVVRVHNTNTGKIIRARFAIDDGRAAVDGDHELPGVAGVGAKVRLEFLDPGGANTGKLLPTGNVLDALDVPGLGEIEASIVDASACGVLVEAKTIGLTGTEMPADLEVDKEIMATLQRIRCAGAVRLGLFETLQEAEAKIGSAPRIGFVAPAQDARTLTGERVKATDGDVTARMISMGDPHRALPLTSGMCLSVAARIEGTTVERNTRPPENAQADVRLIHPSGVMHAGAVVRLEDDGWVAEKVGVDRTQRRLFDGFVYVPAAAVPGLVAARDAKADAAE